MGSAEGDSAGREDRLLLVEVSLCVKWKINVIITIIIIIIFFFFVIMIIICFTYLSGKNAISGLCGRGGMVDEDEDDERLHSHLSPLNG